MFSKYLENLLSVNLQILNDPAIANFWLKLVQKAKILFRVLWKNSYP
jgi:hypothetical protein